MALLTLKQVADELGLKSEQSVRSLAERGEFTIVSVVITGKRGSPRVDSDELDEYRRRLKSKAGATTTVPVAGELKRPGSASRASRPKPPPAFRELRRPGKLMRFE